MDTITRDTAERLYRQGNQAGRGYAPDHDAIDEAAAATGEIVHRRITSDDVAVVRDDSGHLIGIGGDAMGRNAWAVDLTREAEIAATVTDAQIQALETEAGAAGDEAQVDLCRRALAGDATARAKCAAAIAEAHARG